MPSTTVATEPAHDAPIGVWADWVLDPTVDDDEGKCRGIRAAAVLGPKGLQSMLQHIVYERGQS